MKKNKLQILTIIVFVLIFGRMFLIQNISIADAQGDLWKQQTGLGDSESEIGKAFTNNPNDPKDVRVIVADIIKVVLGFVGLILVIIIISAGYKWMTAAGSEEKITEAKNSLTRAAIGLLIILMAWGITEFVSSCLLKATGAANSVWYCPEID